MTILDTNEIRAILPHRYPFLLVDRIVEMEPDRVVGIKNVTFNEPFFTGHFPDFPVMPGVLIVEAMAQTAGVLVLKSIPDRQNKLVLLVAIDYARFRRPVIPGDTLRMEMTIVKRKVSVAKIAGRPPWTANWWRRWKSCASSRIRKRSRRKPRPDDAHPSHRNRGYAGAGRGERRDRPLLHRRRGGGNRSAHPPDGQPVRGRPGVDRRR